MDFITLRKIYLGRHVAQHMKWLGLRDEDLRINRPSRPEWPEHVRNDWQTAAPGAGAPVAKEDARLVTA